MSVSCRLVARELMLPAPGSSWFGEGGENGAVGLTFDDLDVVRLVRDCCSRMCSDLCGRDGRANVRVLAG
mgnify:CR=1 FL=1